MFLHTKKSNIKNINLTTISFDKFLTELNIESEFSSEFIDIKQGVNTYNISNHEGLLKIKLRDFDKKNLVIQFYTTYSSETAFIIVEVVEQINDNKTNALEIKAFKNNNFSNFNTMSATAENACSNENTSPKNPNNHSVNLHDHMLRSALMAASAPIVARLTWFKDKVDYRNPWDIRYAFPHSDDPAATENYGNFHYGATGAALGIPEFVLMRAAGWAQKQTPNTNKTWGHYLGSSPYGDDPNDQEWIKKGINYHKDVFSKKTKNEQESSRDFCNLANEIGERYVPPSGSGGGMGSPGGGSSGGGTGSSGDGSGGGSGGGSNDPELCREDGMVCTGGGCGTWSVIKICS